MSISHLNANDRLRATQAAAALRTSAAYATPAKAPTRQPDAVSLSESALSMSAAQKAVTLSPEVREDRVQAIRAALANGTYAIDTRVLARAMVEKSAL
jgi:negative regulator of flagellin synthesis FlgM